MKTRVLMIALLVSLLGIATVYLYREHICDQDRDRIHAIITSEARFMNVHVKRVGDGLFLEGNVATTEDLNLLFQKVNEVKRGRVVSKVSVQTKNNPN